MRRSSALLALLLGLAACGDRGAAWEEPLAVDGPVVAGGSVAFLHRNLALLAHLDPAAGGTPRAIATSAAPRAFAPIPGGVAVLGGAVRAPRLELLALPEGARTTIDLDAAWDRVEVAPGGRRAVLVFAAEAPAGSGGAQVRNPNLVGVLDVEAGRVETLLLASESAAPRALVFDGDERFAALLYDDAVALVDLADPARHRTLPLQLQGGAVLRPEEAIFSPAGRYLFVRAAGTDDVLAIERIEGEGGFDLAVNFLFAAGLRGLRDVAVAQPLGEAVVALYVDGAALLDAGGDTAANRVAAPLPALEGIVDLGDGLLLLHPAAGGDLLAAWEPLAGRTALERLDRPLLRPPAAAPGVAILPQRGAVTLARVVRDPVRLRIDRQALQLTGDPIALAVDAERRLGWLGLEAPGGGGTLAGVRLDEGAGFGLPLDAPIAAVGIAGGHAFAVHPALLGDLTFVPQDDPRRGAAVRYAGIAAAGMVDREAP